MSDRCSIDGCTNPVEKAGLCAGHRKRKQLGKPVNVLLGPPRSGDKRLTPFQLLEKACDEYAECDVRDDDAFRRVLSRLAYAARVYAASAPPPRKFPTYRKRKRLGWVRSG